MAVTKYLDNTGLTYLWSKIKAWANGLFVHLSGNETIAGAKTFTSAPVLKQTGLSMTVKDTDADTLRTSQVLHANSSNGQYGINIAFCSGGNCVVGGGEAGTAQLSDLAGNSNENLYLVADANIYFKSNGNTWANAKTLSYTNGGNLSFANSNITRGTNPSSDTERAFQWNDSAGNRLAVISNIYYTDSSSITALYAYKTTAATGNNIGRLGIGCDSSGNVYTEAPTPSSKTDSTTKIATTAWVRTATGDFACNAATATAFASSKTVELTGAVTGTASSTGGWSVDTRWRSCLVGRTGSGTSNPWYKVASCSCTSGSSTYCIAFFIDNGSTSSNSSGILRVKAATSSDKTISLASTDFTWVVNNGFSVENFVLVCPTIASPTVEIWTKISVAYLRLRFVVISEGSSTTNATNIAWTLYNTVSDGQEASIPTAGTQVASAASSLEQRVKALEDALQ